MREAWKRPAVANREAPEAHFTLEGSALDTTHMASSSLAHQISSLHSFQIFYSDEPPAQGAQADPDESAETVRRRSRLTGWLDAYADLCEDSSERKAVIAVYEVYWPDPSAGQCQPRQ